MADQPDITPFWKLIAEVKADTTSGSLVVLDRTQEALRLLLNLTREHSEGLAHHVNQALTELLEVHGQLMVLRHFAQELSETLDATDEWGLHGLHRLLEMAIEGYQRQWANAENAVAGQFTQMASPHGKTILLHSYSSTICRVFDHLHENGIRAQVLQTESRPKLEGRLQAAYIAELGYPVTVLPDSAVQHALEWAELVLCGADAVLRDRFINKIGTYPIALACAQYNLPLFVVADSRKFLNSNQWPGEVARDATEVWSNPPKGITAWNQYFEPVPNRLVTSFVTEKNKIFPLGSEEF